MHTLGAVLRRADMRLLAASAIAAATPAVAAAQSTSVAIKDVTVIDGAGGPPRANMTVVVRDGRIVAVDSTSRANIPANATIIGARGKFLIPGLWDMHLHLAKAGDRAFGVFVANGVTSVRDMGGDFRARSALAVRNRGGYTRWSENSHGGPHSREPRTRATDEGAGHRRAGRSLSRSGGRP